MLQGIAATIILAAAIIYAGYKICAQIIRKRKSHCEHCQGCAWKERSKCASLQGKHKTGHTTGNDAQRPSKHRLPSNHKP
jgi:hypothetical protein